MRPARAMERPVSYTHLKTAGIINIADEDCVALDGRLGMQNRKKKTAWQRKAAAQPFGCSATLHISFVIAPRLISVPSNFIYDLITFQNLQQCCQSLLAPCMILRFLHGKDDRNIYLSLPPYRAQRWVLYHTILRNEACRYLLRYLLCIQCLSLIHI